MPEVIWIEVINRGGGKSLVASPYLIGLISKDFLFLIKKSWISLPEIQLLYYAMS